MACLNLNIERIGGSANLLPERVGACSLEVDNIEGAMLSNTIIGGLGLSILLVCKARGGEYLRVTPTEPLWIVLGSDLSYNVRSNTDWIVT